MANASQVRANASHSFFSLPFNLLISASILFLLLSSPGMICTDLGHMGGSNHTKSLHAALRHDKNLLPGFVTVQEVCISLLVPQTMNKLLSSMKFLIFSNGREGERERDDRYRGGRERENTDNRGGRERNGSDIGERGEKWRDFSTGDGFSLQNGAQGLQRRRFGVLG